MKAKQFQTIVQQAADGVLVVDADGIVLFANPASEVLLGRSETTLIGTSLGTPVIVDGSAEIVILRKDGKLVTVEMRAADITWNEEPAVLASLRDVSERARASSQIEHLNSVLRAIRDVNQLIAREKDPTVLIQRACELLVEARGYSSAWIATGDSRGPSKIVAQAGYSDELAPFATSLQQGTWPPCFEPCMASDRVLAVRDLAVSCGLCVRSKDCHHQMALVTALRHDGNVVGLMGVSHAGPSLDDEEERSLLAEVAEDIAFALHAIEIEKRQRETERRLKDAVEAGGVGLWDWDLETQQVFHSAEWKAQIGHRPEEIGDSHEEWMERMHPDDIESTLQRIQLALTPPLPPYEAEFRLRHKDGSYRWIHARGSVDLGPNGQPRRLRGTHVDVTARRLEEDKHRLAQRVAHIGHWELEVYDGIPAWSDEISRIFGFAPGTERPSFANMDALIHPEEWPILVDAVRAGFENGTPFDLVFRILRPGRKPGWMRAIGNATRDANGRIIRLFGTAQDITDFKQGEQALKLERDFSEGLIRTAQAIVLVLDPEGRIVLFNPYLEELSGRRLEDTRGEDWVQTFVPEHSRAGTRKRLGGAIEGISTRGLVDPLLTRDGRELLIEWNDKTLSNSEGKLTGLLCVGQDVTARQRAEEALRESREYLGSIIDTIADPVFVKDEHLRFTLVNTALCALMGKSREELIGTTGGEVLSPEELERYLAVDRRVLSTGAQDVSELPFTAPDGTSRAIATKKTRHIDHQGAKYVVGVIRDLTELRGMQAQLAQADRLSSMGLLAAGVAHEINNPLSYILYNLESLTEELPELLAAIRQTLARLSDLAGTSDLRETLGPAFQLMNPVMLDDILARFKDALDGTYRIRDVARGLGVFSRVEKDQLVPVNLMHVIDVATNMSFNEVKYRARLVKDYGSKVPTVMASEGRLSQVFLNLIINATHAIDEGDRENNEIRIKTWAEAGQVCAQVRDTGSGITPENLGKIFDSFFTTKEIGVGSGLGLAISKGIVEGYGGTIEVESEVGTGTRFTIRLPVATAAAAVEAPAKSERGPVVRGRILIVDDEAGIRAAMVRMLHEHDAVQATSGAQAEEILENDQDFDLILCDMMMPNVSGMELHEWLTTRHPRLAEQFIFITGGAFTPRARKYLSQVDNIRLEKPLDAANFKKIVGDRIHMARGTRPG